MKYEQLAWPAQAPEPLRPEAPTASAKINKTESWMEVPAVLRDKWSSRLTGRADCTETCRYRKQISNSRRASRNRRSPRLCRRQICRWLWPSWAKSSTLKVAFGHSFGVYFPRSSAQVQPCLLDICKQSAGLARPRGLSAKHTGDDSDDCQMSWTGGCDAALGSRR
ncbi:hypothetical protein NL676_033330 [Syzygium grande]|nr:hypothetical protein NL676_033330 [Syzygium grande]